MTPDAHRPFGPGHVSSLEFEAHCTGLAIHLIDEHDLLVDRDEYGSFGIDAGSWSRLAGIHRDAHEREGRP